MKMRMLKHCPHCGKLQLFAFDERKVCDPFKVVKAIVYTSKCKKCNHFITDYKEV